MYDRATQWTAEKVTARSASWTHRLRAPTGPPPELVGDDPATQYEQARTATIDAYAAAGVMESMLKGFGGEVPAFVVFGIAFCDQLNPRLGSRARHRSGRDDAR